MTFTVILFISRPQNLNPAAFKHEYESNYLPILKSIVGNDFPLSHTRHYVEPDHTYQQPPYFSIGHSNQAATHHEVVTVYTFINKGHWIRFQDKIRAWEGDGRNANDCEGLGLYKSTMTVDQGSERVRMLVIGDTKCTGRDGGDVGWRFVGSV